MYSDPLLLHVALLEMETLGVGMLIFETASSIYLFSNGAVFKKYILGGARQMCGCLQLPSDRCWS